MQRAGWERNEGAVICTSVLSHPIVARIASTLVGYDQDITKHAPIKYNLQHLRENPPLDQPTSYPYIPTTHPLPPRFPPPCPYPGKRLLLCR